TSTTKTQQKETKRTRKQKNNSTNQTKNQQNKKPKNRQPKPPMDSRPGKNASSACRSSSRFFQRLLRSRSRPRSTTRSSAAGNSGRTIRIDGGSSATMRAIVAIASPVWNGAWPVNRKYNVAATEYTSACWSTFSIRTCSGAENSGVPINVPVLVRWLSPTSDLVSPKSPTLTRPLLSKKQLDGLTSRWTKPSRCASSK